MILTQAQAQAVFNAICAMNDLGRVSSEFCLPNGVLVQCNASGAVHVAPEASFAKWERYATQADFAQAYAIQ